MLDRILRDLNVRPLINASATETPLGGSFMNLKVVQAMDEASQHFFDVRELHQAVSHRLAALTQNEDAMVSAGVASAVYLVTMALLKLEDPVFFEKIPAEFPQNKSVIIYQSHHVEYVCGIQQAGVELRVIENLGENHDLNGEKLEKAIKHDKPLAFMYVMAGLWIPPGAPTLDKTIEVCKKHGVPVIVDAAAQLPPKSNLWELTRKGADVVLFSGGKDLQGPSHTGLILGRPDIVSTCRGLISPQDGVGRFFKIGKEELIATLVSVEEYLKHDEAERLEWSENEVKAVIEGLASLPGIVVERAFPNEAGQPIPRARITYDQNLYPVTPENLVEDFMKRDTRIAFMLNPGKGFYVNPMTLKPGESQVIIDEIKDYFSNLNR